jgi:hypothetical protein
MAEKTVSPVKTTLSFSKKVVKGWSLTTIATKLNNNFPNRQSEERKRLLNEIKERPMVDILEWIKAFTIGLKEGHNPELKDHQIIILGRLIEIKLNKDDLYHIKHKLGHLDCFQKILLTYI